MQTEKFLEQTLKDCTVEDLLNALLLKNKEFNKKFAQCRYCVNSSNEGSGIWLDKEHWICRPCVDKISKARDELER